MSKHLVVAVLAAGLALPVWADERSALLKVSPAQMQAMAITVAPLQAVATGAVASFPAQVVLPQGAERIVSTPVVALIEQVLVQPGQAVKAGTPLLRLASTELGQAQLQLAQAGARSRLAQQALAREQALFAEGIIPERRVQEAKAAAALAQAEAGQARAALRLMGLPPVALERVAAGGAPQDGLTLTAPQAGTVADIAVQAGQRVDASSLLMRLVQAGAIGLEIQVPAAQAAAYPVGTALSVAGGSLGSASGNPLRAHVRSVSTSVAPGSQTRSLRATLDDAQAASALRPGEAVTVQMSAPAAPLGATAWSVPLAAVARDGQQAHVFVQTPQGFEARPVQVLASAGQVVRVTGALKAGEAVAVTGVIALKGAWLKEAP
jgi:cobalt-zinc-cadmium efflux system membrane fusion protein